MILVILSAIIISFSLCLCGSVRALIAAVPMQCIFQVTNSCEVGLTDINLEALTEAPRHGGFELQVWEGLLSNYFASTASSTVSAKPGLNSLCKLISQSTR